MFKSYPLRALILLAFFASAGSAARAQQPTDLDKLVAPIADAISRSGKHKVLVLPLRGLDAESEVGALLGKQISARLAATVPGFQETKLGWSEPLSKLGRLPIRRSVANEIGQKNGAEIVVSGSFSFFDEGLGVSLSVLANAQNEDGDELLAIRNGFLPYTPDIPRPAELPEKYRAGMGGVSLPRCIRCPGPHYAESDRRKRIEGIVTLQLIVGNDGRVSGIQVINAVSPGLADAAVAAARKFRFEPAKGPDGKPVPVLVNYEVAFRLF